jgi:hypothetical protein
VLRLIGEEVEDDCGVELKEHCVDRLLYRSQK